MTTTTGLLLVVLGAAGIAWGTFTWTSRTRLVDIGPIHATRDEQRSTPLPAIVGSAVLIGGIALLVAGRRG